MINVTHKAWEVPSLAIWEAVLPKFSWRFAQNYGGTLLWQFAYSFRQTPGYTPVKGTNI